MNPNPVNRTTLRTKREIAKDHEFQAVYEKELNSFKLDSSGKRAMALCPFHNDTKPSLSVNLINGRFHCFGCKAKGSIIDFIMKKDGVDHKTASAKLSSIGGIKIENPIDRKIIKTYDYLGEEGNLLFQVVRYEPKNFRQRRPDGKGGWIWNLDGVQLAPYNLPDILNAKKRKVLLDRKIIGVHSPTVYIVEGEKDANTLKELGLIATCNPMGAGKWRPEYNHYFKGKIISILPDNDKPGSDHALKVAKNLNGIAESVKIVELPGLQEKEDVTDWTKQGHTKEELIELIKQSPEWIEEQPKSLLSSLLKWNDIFTLDVKIEYLLEKLIPKGGITLMFGRGGIGKTSLSMQIARAVANGLPFEGLSTIKTPGYYIDFENPLAVLKERVEKIGQSDNLYVWHISNIIQPPKLDSDEWELYKQLPAGLIIFDTLRAANLSDENDSRPASLIMGRLKELREMEFTILLLHHTPKANDNIFKGSTAFLDLCDHVLGLEEVKYPKGESVLNCDNLYRFGWRQKTRYEPDEIHLTFDPQIKGFRLAVDPDIERMEGICEILRRLPNPLKQQELTEQIKTDMDLPDGQVRKLLKKGTGLYWNTQKGNKHNAIHYIPVSQFSDTIYKEKTEKLTNGAIIKPILRLPPLRKFHLTPFDIKLGSARLIKK